MCVLSPIVTVPVRGSSAFEETRYDTVPFPAPLVPSVSVSHFAVLRAVHWQTSLVAIVKLPVSASASKVRRSGSIDNRHDPASCISRTRLSLMTSSPSRIAGTGLGATTNSTLPSPCPDAGDTLEIQLACVETVHMHSG